MAMPHEHPKDNLVRAWASPDAVVLRASTDGAGNTMHGHFAVFDQWTEIVSAYEGRFLERIAPGAFKDTFKDPTKKIRVLYDHGADPMIGNKPLGSPDVLREDKTGAYYEVGLFDASYVNDLKPAIRAGQLGASFRFSVTGDQWVSPKEPTKNNPAKLDERTITSVDLYEFGPVTFPAYEAATVGLRSRTDEFNEHMLKDPVFVARFEELYGPRIANKIAATIGEYLVALGQIPSRMVTNVDLSGVPTTTGAAIVASIRANRASSPMTSAEREPAPTAPEVVPEPPTEPEPPPDETADGGEAETRERRLAYLQRSMAGFEAHLTRLERSP